VWRADRRFPGKRAGEEEGKGEAARCGEGKETCAGATAAHSTAHRRGSCIGGLDFVWPQISCCSSRVNGFKTSLAFYCTALCQPSFLFFFFLNVLSSVGIVKTLAILSRARDTVSAE
jgi:hypothetical protein